MFGTLELVAVSEGYQTVSSMRPAELTECDDVVLLSRSRSGDVAAFGELVRRHQDAALRLAAVIGGQSLRVGILCAGGPCGHSCEWGSCQARRAKKA